MQQQYNKKTDEKTKKRENLKFRTVELYDKLKKFDFKKALGLDYISESGITVHDIDDCIHKLESCGSSTIVAKKTEVYCGGLISDTEKIIESNCCHEYTICPICASAKRNNIINGLRPYIEIIHNVPKTYLYISTISIKGSSSPLKDYEKLRSSWTKFIKMGQRRGRSVRSGGESSKIIGSLLSIEIVPEIENKNHYHVHGHALLVCSEPLEYVVYDQKKKKELSELYGKNIPKEYLDDIVLKKILIPDYKEDEEIQKEVAVSKISEEWFKSSGYISFWVKPLKERSIKGKWRSVESQLYEIIKYSTKPWELSPLVLMELWGALKGKRRITKGGIFTNNKRSQQEWRKRLNDCGLLDDWDKLKPDNIDGDPVEQPVNVVNKYYQSSYDRKKNSFYNELCHTDYSYKEKKEYKRYMATKARVIGEYRSNVSRHIVGMKIALQFGKLSSHERLVWIAKKERIKTDMRLRIYDETDNIKNFILKQKATNDETEILDIPKEEFHDYWKQRELFSCQKL